MKRLTLLFLVLIFIVSVPLLSSCNLSTYETFDKAFKKTEELDSIDVTMEMNIKMEMTGMNMDIPVRYNFKATGMKGETPKLIGDINMAIIGMEMNLDIYDDGENTYVSMNGEKFKISADQTEMADEYDMLKELDSMVVDLPENVFSDAVFTKDVDGTQMAELTMAKEQFNELFANLVDSAAASATEGAGIDNIDMDDIKLKIYINKDGYISQYDINFVMNIEMDVMGTALTAKVSADCSSVYNNPGAAVTIDPPDDLDSYIAMPEQ